MKILSELTQVGTTTKVTNLNAEAVGGIHITVAASDPATSVDGDLWIDTDATPAGGTSGGASAARIWFGG